MALDGWMDWGMDGKMDRRKGGQMDLDKTICLWCNFVQTTVEHLLIFGGYLDLAIFAVKTKSTIT